MHAAVIFFLRASSLLFPFKQAAHHSPSSTDCSSSQATHRTSSPSSAAAGQAGEGLGFHLGEEGCEEEFGAVGEKRRRKLAPLKGVVVVDFGGWDRCRAFADLGDWIASREGRWEADQSRRK